MSPPEEHPGFARPAECRAEKLFTNAQDEVVVTKANERYSIQMIYRDPVKEAEAPEIESYPRRPAFKTGANLCAHRHESITNSQALIKPVQ